MTGGASGNAASALIARNEIDTRLIYWLEHGTSKYFHLVGPPGSGKTSWLQGLIEKREVRSGSGTLLAVIAAEHFCQWNNAGTSSAIGFLQRVSQQLAALDSTYRTTLLREAGRSRNISINQIQIVKDSHAARIRGPEIGTISINAEKPADVIESLFRIPIQEALASEGCTWLLLVDAPDEPAVKDVADLLVSLGTLPPRFRIVVATRPNAEIERELKSLDAELCSLSTIEGTAESVVRYIQSEVIASGWQAQATLTPALGIDELVRSLSVRSGGNFLVARCALQAIRVGSRPITERMIEELPDNLSGYYRLFLGRLNRETKRRWQDDGARILGTLAIAREPLTESDLASLGAISRGTVRNLVSQIRPFLEAVGDRQWRLYHATFAEFLLDEAKADEFWCPAEEQHARIVQWIMGKQDATPDWEDTPEYGIRHIVHHIIGAKGASTVAQLDYIVSPAYLRRRFRSGSTLFDLSSDFRRALVAVSDCAATYETLFFASLLTYWQDRIAAEANPSSTILLAALGRVDEAVAIARKQDDAAHTHAHDSIRLQSEFATGLIRLGEIDAAIDFARGLEGAARTTVCWSAFNALALEDPERALSLRSLDPFGGKLELSGDAFKAIASVPQGLQAALDASPSDEDHIKISEGWAKHDLDHAIKFIHKTEIRRWWLSGERFVFTSKNRVANVLSAFLDFHTSSADVVWQRAEQLLGARWPMPYGALLASKFTALAPERGLAAFERLGLDPDGLSHLLARAWLSAMGGSVLFEKFSADIILEKQADTDDGRWLHRLREQAGLGDALHLLALIEPHQIARHGPSFQLLTHFGERLLAVLNDEKDRPESKARGALALGKLAAWLGDDVMVELLRLGKRNWRNELWQHECGKGFSASLARRSVHDYISAQDGPSSCAWWEGGVQIASEIIAKANPLDMLALIDSVDVRNLNSRAKLIGIAAIEMRRSGIGSLAALTPRLGRYVDGATFSDYVRITRSIAYPTECPVNLSDAAAAKRAVDAAIADPNQSAKDAIDRVEALSDVVGTPFEGEIIWSKDLRRKLSVALETADPVAALRLIIPTANTEVFKDYGARFLRKDPMMNDWRKLAHWLLSAVSSPARSWNNSNWQSCLLTGFALALPIDSRRHFIAEATVEGSSLHAEVSARLDGYECPADVLRDFITIRQDDTPYHYPSFLDAVKALAEAGDPVLFERLKEVFAERQPNHVVVATIGSSWPRERWEDCLSACRVWIEQHSDWHREHLFLHLIEGLIPRAAQINLNGILTAIDRLGDEYSGAINKAYILRKIIGKISEQERPSERDWPDLIETVRRIDEPVALRYALLDMLAATRRLDTDKRARPTNQTIAALALGSREMFIDNVEAVCRTAVGADAHVTSRLAGIGDRVKTLLEADASADPARAG